MKISSSAILKSIRDSLDPVKAAHKMEMAQRKAARDKRYAAINNRPTHWKFGRSKYIPGGARMNVNHQPKAMRG